MSYLMVELEYFFFLSYNYFSTIFLIADYSICNEEKQIQILKMRTEVKNS